MKRLAGWLFSALVAASLSLGVVVALLGITTMHGSDIIRVQRADFSRMVFCGGSMILTRQPREWSGRAAMIDFHVRSRFQAPAEWFALRANAVGVRRGTIEDERVCIIPLWIIISLAAILPVFALIRGRRKIRLIRPEEAVLWLWQCARRATIAIPIVLCCVVAFLWLYSLCWYGFELDSYALPTEVESFGPGYVRVYVPSSTELKVSRSDDWDEDKEWSGWVLRVMAPFKTGPSTDSFGTPPWRIFPGFEIEPEFYTGDGSSLFSPVASGPVIGHWVWIPYWFLSLLAAAYPGSRLFIRVARQRRSRHRQAQQQCATCGYDMRATPDRCPECGTAIVNK